MASRYEDAKTEKGIYRGRLVKGKQIRKVPYQRFAWTPHHVQDGERFDLIAEKYYSDPSMWWRIADVNPERFWWGDLGPEDVIRIPHV